MGSARSGSGAGTPRTTAVIIGRQKSILLPWFDEGQPTEAELSNLMAILNRPGGGPVPADFYKPIGTREPVLRLFNIAQLKLLRDALRASCRVPIEVRGLSSSSQYQDECGAGPVCKNVALADRRGELLTELLNRTVLTTSEVAGNDARDQTDEERGRLRHRP